jgi:hypothetical protein
MPPIPKLVRTPDELKAARRVLGLSADDLATMVLRMGDGRTVRRWETGDSEIPGPVIVVLETAMDFLSQREAISRQLEMMHAGKMTVGTMHFGNMEKNNTPVRIAQLEDARNSLDEALAILTRQPPGDGSSTDRVHWYDMRRLSYGPGEKHSWSLPGETSPEAALAYFERDAGLPNALEICDDDDPAAEFKLEKRPVLRTQSGASQHLRPGNDVLGTFYIKPAVHQGRYKIEIMQRGLAGPIREKTVEPADLEKLKVLGHDFFNKELGQQGVVGVHSVRVCDSKGRVIYRKSAGDL